MSFHLQISRLDVQNFFTQLDPFSQVQKDYKLRRWIERIFFSISYIKNQDSMWILETLKDVLMARTTHLIGGKFGWVQYLTIRRTCIPILMETT